jgi:hypothetical protein
MGEGEEVAPKIVKMVSPDCKSIVVEATPYYFTIGTRAKWEVVVAGEDIELKKGELTRIKIEPLHLPSDVIAVPCAFNYHAFVDLLKVGGSRCPKPVEKPRSFDYADVMAIKDYKLHRGEALGVLNLFPVIFTRYATSPRIISVEEEEEVMEEFYGKSASSKM